MLNLSNYTATIDVIIGNSDARHQKIGKTPEFQIQYRFPRPSKAGGTPITAKNLQSAFYGVNFTIHDRS
jgi:hypothetical protein